MGIEGEGEREREEGEERQRNDICAYMYMKVNDLMLYVTLRIISLIHDCNTSRAPTHFQFNRHCSVEWSLINLRHVLQPQQEVGGVYLLQRQEVHVGRETLCYTYIL